MNMILKVAVHILLLQISIAKHGTDLRLLNTMSGGQNAGVLMSTNTSMAQCTDEDFCSSWYYCEEGHCKCGNELGGMLKCNQIGKVYILDRSCMTYSNMSHRMEAGHCIYNYEVNNDFKNRIYHSVPANKSRLADHFCGKAFNRAGTLCGRCKEDHYPMAYSFNMTCIPCHGGTNWLKYALAAFLPLTFFCFVVLFLKINAASSHLHGFVFYSQAVSIPALARHILLASQDTPTFMIMTRFVCMINGIWNLDFFRSMNLEICLRLNTLQNLALDLAVGIYPLLLMVLSYFLINLYDNNFKPLVVIWKPFRHLFSLFSKNWEIRTSVIDAFGTFFLLSNVKFLSVSFDLLVPVDVHQLHSNGDLSHSLRLYYDATIPFFSKAHLPYAILGMVVFLLLVVLPLLLLILYPFRWFQKFLNLFPVRWYVLHTFMDSFHASYKNGTEPGSWDCRWFAALFLVARLFLFLLGALTQNSMYFVTSSMFLTVFVAVLVMVEPYKASHRHYTSITAVFVLLVPTLHLCLTGIEFAEAGSSEIAYVFYVLPAIISLSSFLYFPVIIIHKLGLSRCIRYVLQRIRAWKWGYQTL